MIVSRKIDKIILHCSATPNGKDIGAKEIRKYHMEQRGWKDIGYHYVIRLDGTVEKGRAESVAGAHCTGQNANSIGICLVGGVAADGKTPEDGFTDAQMRALAELLEKVFERYPKATLHGHNEFANKACPVFDVDEFVMLYWNENIRKRREKFAKKGSGRGF